MFEKFIMALAIADVLMWALYPWYLAVKGGQ